MADAQLEAKLILNVGDFDRSVKDVEKSIKEVVSHFDDLEKAQQEVGDSFKRSEQDNENLQKALDDLKRAEKEAAKHAEELGKTLSKTSEDAKHFEKSTQSASKELKAANSSAYELGIAIGTNLRSAILKFGTAFLSFKAAQTAIRAVADEAERASGIVNKSMSLNVDADKLQGAYFAAKKVGLSADNVNDILKDINDKMGDLTLNDGGEMKDFFKALNLDVNEFIGKDPISVLLGINKAAANLSSQERANIFESMGNDLDFLKPLLADNAEAFQKNIDKAKEFGLVIQGADLAAYHEFKNTLTDIGARFEGLRTQVLAGLAEPFKEAAAFVDEWIESLGGAEEVANTVADGLVEGLKMAVEVAAWLAEAFYAIKPAIDMIVAGVALMVRGILEVIEAAAKIPGSPLYILNQADGSFLSGIESAQDILDGYIGQMKTLDESFKNSAQRIEQIENFKNGFNNALSKGQDTANSRFAAKMELPELEVKVAELSKAIKSAQDRVDEARNSPNKSTEQLTEALSNLAIVEKAQKEAIEELTKAQQLQGKEYKASDDGEASRRNYSNKVTADEQDKYGKSLEKEHKRLLKEQEEQLSWRRRLDMDDAKERDRVNRESAKELEKANKEAQKEQKRIASETSKASSTMLSAANLMNSSTEAKQKNSSPLALDNPQMSFFTGAPVRETKDPTGRGYTGMGQQNQVAQTTQQNLGSITISVATKDGIISQFPVLGNVKTLQELKTAVESIMNQYARTGEAANS